MSEWVAVAVSRGPKSPCCRADPRASRCDCMWRQGLKKVTSSALEEGEMRGRLGGARLGSQQLQRPRPRLLGLSQSSQLSKILNQNQNGGGVTQWKGAAGFNPQ